MLRKSASSCLCSIFIHFSMFSCFSQTHPMTCAVSSPETPWQQRPKGPSRVTEQEQQKLWQVSDFLPAFSCKFGCEEPEFRTHKMRTCNWERRTFGCNWVLVLETAPDTPWSSSLPPRLSCCQGWHWHLPASSRVPLSSNIPVLLSLLSRHAQKRVSQEDACALSFQHPSPVWTFQRNPQI